MTEEYEVLSWLLETEQISADTKILVLRPNFAPRENDDAFHTYLEKHLKGVEQDTLLDFVQKSSSDQQVERRFGLKLPYIILDDEDGRSIFSTRNGWNDFYEKFEGASGLIEVSRVGFNTAHSQALVCMGKQSDWTAGYGLYYLLAKENDSWSITNSTMAWIS